MRFGLFSRPLVPIIREAKPKDATALARIHATGFERGWDALDFERLLGESGIVAQIATPGASATPIGFALSRRVIDEAELLTIAVAPESRRHGVGRKLLDTHLGRLAAHGARRVFLEVAEDNQAAIRLYRAFGFAEIGRRPGYYARRGGKPANAIVMRRAL